MGGWGPMFGTKSLKTNVFCYTFPHSIWSLAHWLKISCDIGSFSFLIAVMVTISYKRQARPTLGLFGKIAIIISDDLIAWKSFCVPSMCEKYRMFGGKMGPSTKVLTSLAVCSTSTVKHFHILSVNILTLWACICVQLCVGFNFNSLLWTIRLQDQETGNSRLH